METMIFLSQKKNLVNTKVMLYQEKQLIEYLIKFQENLKVINQKKCLMKILHVNKKKKKRIFIKILKKKN
jgi:hypothetical protein